LQGDFTFTGLLQGKFYIIYTPCSSTGAYTEKFRNTGLRTSQSFSTEKDVRCMNVKILLSGYKKEKNLTKYSCFFQKDTYSDTMFNDDPWGKNIFEDMDFDEVKLFRNNHTSVSPIYICTGYE
jgi:hypothetical protein